MSFYAVFGNPVAHSRSPQIHALFAEQQGLPIRYERILTTQACFQAAVTQFFAEGGQGANITVPFKTEAFARADTLSPRAQAAGAVNTLCLCPDGKIFGDNTDGIGLVRDIVQLNGFSLNNQRILLLGAGGAARGVLQPLLAEKPISLTIANRTLEKAKQLAHDFDTAYSSFSELSAQTFDVIINATSGSLSGDLLPISDTVLAKSQLSYDMMYAAKPTLFLEHAAEQGCPLCLDGLGMLVSQAAASYSLWRGFEPDVQTVLKELRKELEKDISA
ncbi:shikimate dehydrogenase [Stenoxybacter acetivorans]|uniref:shikimate dehydrogenase n=1 Tax=Stenoxybacter acetivorans TaxID=422441 RepID=UPI00056B017E|nr:shikimate dehydrogenase [Stenoxybacter acetivorans]